MKLMIFKVKSVIYNCIDFKAFLKLACLRKKHFNPDLNTKWYHVFNKL